MKLPVLCYSIFALLINNAFLLHGLENVQGLEQNQQIEKKNARKRIDEQKNRIEELFEKSRQEKMTFEQHFNQRSLEHAKWLEQFHIKYAKRENDFSQSKLDFEEHYQSIQENLKEEYRHTETEFNHARDEFLKKLRKNSETFLEKTNEIDETKLLQKHFRDSIKNTREVDFPKKSCCGNSAEARINEKPSVYVFMSFSIPQTIWLSLSQDLCKIGGTFVVRGLPQGSFKEFARLILMFKEAGIEAPIELDPRKFHDYNITGVPAFVVKGEQGFDKLSGNISLNFALDQLSNKGESNTAKNLSESQKVEA